MKTKTYLSPVIPSSFTLLWGYACVVQLGQIEQTKRAMAMQLFPLWVADILYWLLPCLHLLLVLILLYRPWLRIGMLLSILLLLAYTTYLIIGVSKIWGGTPCACAGIWPTNNHWIHITFNSLFIILGIYWILAHSSRPAGDVLPDVGRKEDTAAS